MSLSVSHMEKQSNFRRIILTGGGGFAGGYLAPMLASAFPEARRWSLGQPGSHHRIEGWQTIDIDSKNASEIDDCIRTISPDLVVHLAAQSSVAAGFLAAEQTWKTNFGLTFHLAGACARYSPSATFFHTSSSEVYGKSFNDGVVSEGSDLRPVSTYGRSKAAAEAMLYDILTPDNQIIIVRSFNHTGPGQDRRFVIPSFLAQIAELERGRREAKIMVGNIEVMREFLDVRDVCEAYLSLLRTSFSQERYEIYNVCSGQSYRLADLLDIMRGLATREFTIESSAALIRPVDIPQVRGENTKLHAATGWTPSRDIQTTLRDTLEFWRRNITEPAPPSPKPRGVSQA